MKFSCNQIKLSEAVLKVQRAVAIKSNISALDGILIRTKENQIELCGYDLELGIKTTIDAEVQEQGSIVLNAKLFSEIVRRLPEQTVNIEIDSNLIATITCEYCNFSIVGLSAEDYPSLPQFDNASEVLISQTTLKSMIRQTIFAVAETDDKPVHTGTLFDIKDGEITLVSVDGYRFAMRKESLTNAGTHSFVIPGKTLVELLRLIPEEDKDLRISIGSRHIIFDLEDCSIISRLLEGEFLEYNSAIPSTTSTEVKVNTREFIASLERVSLLITDKLKSPVCCLFAEDTISLSCTTTVGKGLDKLVAEISGSKLEIGFNSKYLLDALKNADTDEVKIQMNGSLSPMKITPISGESFVFLVLPVRISRTK